MEIFRQKGHTHQQSLYRQTRDYRRCFKLGTHFPCSLRSLLLQTDCLQCIAHSVNMIHTASTKGGDGKVCARNISGSRPLHYDLADFSRRFPQWALGWQRIPSNLQVLRRSAGKVPWIWSQRFLGLQPMGRCIACAPKIFSLVPLFCSRLCPS